MDPLKPGGEESPTAPDTPESPSQQWLIGDWLADSRLDELRRGDEVFKIEPRNMRLLVALAQRPGEVLTVDSLLTEVWADLVVTQSSVYQAVSQLRQVMGDEASRPRYIATVPRKGYRLVAVVQPVRMARTPVPAEPAAGELVEAPERLPEAAPVLAPVIPVVPIAAIGRSRRGWLIGGGAAAVAGVGGLAAWWQLAGRVLPENVRLAVLPFQDTSAHKLEQPLADGLAEQVIGALASHRQVRVLSRATSFQFHSPDALLPLAEQRFVTHVLGGELARTATRLALNLRLHGLPGQRLLWQEALEVELADLSRLALRVANHALLALGAAPVAGLASQATPADAYELYLTGLQHQRSIQMPGILKARDYFQRAIDRDAGFAPAYVGQAATWIAEFHYGSGLSLRDMDARAQPLIDRALQLAPELPLAQGLQGHLKANLSLHDEARRWLAPALQRSPSDVTLLTWTAKNEMDDGHPAAAGPLLQRAAELSPLAVQVQHLAGLAATYAGRYDEARAHYQRAMVLAPQHANGPWGLGLVGYARGQLAEAVGGYRKALVVDPQRDALWLQLGWLYLDLGLPDEARHAFAQSQSQASHPAESQLAATRLLLGDEAALRRTLTGLQLPGSGARDLEIDAALLWVRLGDLPRARRLLEPAVGLMLADPLPAWGNWDAFQGRHVLIDAAAVYLALGEPARAEPLLAQAEAFLKRYRQQGNVWHTEPYLRARIEALRQRPQAAAAALEEAVALGWRRSWWIAHDPALASVRTLPRVEALQAQVAQKVDADRRALVRA
ncbi:winged helix-turn-helix domain-containing protein [Roseateles sp.]|uniref:winged helix-turn-helix domain-containing protein n=1 Tax=Roseateles sp. TaxID=1971397 RepID=UPI003266B8C3